MPTETALKSAFTRDDFVRILSSYDLGALFGFQRITRGQANTIYVLRTSRGKFVFKHHEHRSRRMVAFEIAVIRWLERKRYPGPTVLKARDGKYIGTFRKKPFAMFRFAEGRHLARLNRSQRGQLIRRVAELHNATRGFRPIETKDRMNFNRRMCIRYARAQAREWPTATARRKLAWLKGELSTLVFPRSLPMGICHCDFNPSNVLWQRGRFSALLDFDLANYTYLLFDLVNLIEFAAWSYREGVLSIRKARWVIQEYVKYRPLGRVEQTCLFDVYKLSILIDCIWFFRRGGARDFKEKRKIDHLNAMGRTGFHRALFA